MRKLIRRVRLSHTAGNKATRGKNLGKSMGSDGTLGLFITLLEKKLKQSHALRKLRGKSNRPEERGEKPGPRTRTLGGGVSGLKEGTWSFDFFP